MPPWEAGAIAHPLVADDGTFDSMIEAVSGSVDTTGLSLGDHLIFVRGQDTTGTWGPVTAIFLEITNTPPPTPTPTASPTPIITDWENNLPFVPRD